MTGGLTLRRVAGIAGLAYVVGVSIENMEVLDAATLSSPVAEIRAGYADHALAAVSAFAGALALLAYTGLAALLYAWLREFEAQVEPWRTIMLLGGIGGPTVAAVGLAASAVLVAGGPTSDELTGALYDFYLLCRIVSAVFVALFLGGLALATLRSGALPRPLPELALAIAAAMALAPIAAFDQASGLELAVKIAFATQTLWIFLAAIWMTLADGVGAVGFVRRGAFLLLVLAAGLIGIALIAVPGATGQFFAWGLGPEPLAAFAGGVYVGSAIAYAIALPRSARLVRGLVAGAVMLSVSVFIVTVTHIDQFDFDRLQAIMWVILFAAFSAITLALLFLERDGELESAQPLPGWARGLLGAIALAAGALALAPWVDPTALAGPAPFEVPPLGGRFAGAWAGLLAVACGWAAARNRLDEARTCGLVLIALPAGALAAGLRTIDQLEPASVAAAYLAVLAALALSGIAVVSLGRQVPFFGQRAAR